MSVVRDLSSRDGVIELTTADGERIRDLKQLAAYLASHRKMPAQEYRLLGAVAIALTAAGRGSPLDRLSLLKFRDVHYMTLPGRDAAAAFSDGEREAADKFANVDPQSTSFDALVRDLTETTG